MFVILSYSVASRLLMNDRAVERGKSWLRNIRSIYFRQLNIAFAGGRPDARASEQPGANHGAARRGQPAAKDRVHGRQCRFVAQPRRARNCRSANRCVIQQCSAAVYCYCFQMAAGSLCSHAVLEIVVRRTGAGSTNSAADLVSLFPCGHAAASSRSYAVLKIVVRRTGAGPR